jgi:hypothetical protein
MLCVRARARVCVYPVLLISECLNPYYMKYGMYIMASEPI